MKGLEIMLDKAKAPASEPGEGDELADAMSDLGEALADKDWKAAATAFRRACSLCEDSYEDSGDDEE